MIYKIKDIINFFNKEYPKNLSEDWDNSGIQFENKNKNCKKIMVALDLTNGVLDEAINKKVNLILIHHPFFFGEKNCFEKLEFPYEKEIFRKIQKSNISVFAIHTNYDNSLNGMPKKVSEFFGFYQKIENSNFGISLRCNESFNSIKKILNKKSTKIIEKNFKKNIKINKICFLPGAGSPQSIFHFRYCDLIITSDIKWSTWIMAEEEKINLIQVSHSIEKVFICHIK